MTKIELPYSIGSKVWITNDCFSYSREVSCLACCNTGVVKLLNNSSQPCGVCSGRGVHSIHKDYRCRPTLHTITGFTIHNKTELMEIWWYTDKSSTFVRTENIVTSFQMARKLCRKFNKKHGWPEEDYQRAFPEKHRHFWGYRIKESTKK